MGDLLLVYKCRFCGERFARPSGRPPRTADGLDFFDDPAAFAAFHRCKPGVLGYADLVAVGDERDLDLRAIVAAQPGD